MKIILAHTLKNLIQKYQLAFTIVIAVAATLFLTGLSLMLYVITGTASLDLSRPGYEVAREQVKHSTKDKSQFDADGPMNTDVMKDFLKKYEKRNNAIHSYDAFNQKLLEDASLGITTEQIAPHDGASP